MKLHLIMPMGGAGSRFTKDGFELPKPMLPLNGKPFLYWATESVLNSADIEDITFVVLQEHIGRFGIDKEIKKYYPDARIEVLPCVLKGAVLTCLEGVKSLKDDEAVIFNDCDHYFEAKALAGALNKGDADGLLLTFTADEPKYSFVEYGENGNVIRTVEKEVISRDAICGAYYFRSAAMFKKYAAAYLESCTYAEFFMSGVYNNMIQDGKVVKTAPTDIHVPFGTPEEYESAVSYFLSDISNNTSDGGSHI